jgi:hypothetical protein
MKETLITFKELIEPSTPVHYDDLWNMYQRKEITIDTYEFLLGIWRTAFADKPRNLKLSADAGEPPDFKLDYTAVQPDWA